MLYEVNGKVDFAYFPTSGICSVIAQNAEGVQIETGLIGREGFVGIPIVLYVDSTPSQVVVQAEGRALRISRAKLLNSIRKSPSLSATLLRFAHTFNVQISQTALSHGHFTIHQRLARWLLMCQDRVDSHEFPMTHKFLSVMLAVRRAGITDALNYLEGKRQSAPCEAGSSYSTAQSSKTRPAALTAFPSRNISAYCLPEAANKSLKKFRRAIALGNKFIPQNVMGTSSALTVLCDPSDRCSCPRSRLGNDRWFNGFLWPVVWVPSLKSGGALFL